VRFDISTHTDGARIRYPEGMSWQVAGNLRLAELLSGVLSGRVQMERVNLLAVWKLPSAVRRRSRWRRAFHQLNFPAQSAV